ncbi:MAG: hypothetical protein JW771_06065 [Candidatus Thermoplasmatota archaeon]|nr:hypothetical protein [Candidatus Thermoplasmatota archaeon]
MAEDDCRYLCVGRRWLKVNQHLYNRRPGYGNDTMVTELQKALRTLSEVYDVESKDTFVSCYINKHDDPKFLQRREHACASLLGREEQENFQQTMQEIKDFLQIKNVTYGALFASYKHRFFHYVSLPVTINNLFVVDSSPYIRPLARINDEWESFTLVLLDSHYAKVLSVSLGRVDQTRQLSADIMNKHKKGGMSQARFQRLRKGAMHTFFTEVIGRLEAVADDRIILAGPGQAKKQFHELLPQHLASRVVDVIDIDIDDEQELLQESLHLISQREDTKSHDAVKQLKAEILRDGLVAYGIDETLQAVKNGQVDLLLVEKDYKVKGCLCEHCQILRAGPINECPVCGGHTTEADVIEEIIEFAERTDATVEFSDDEELARLGHVGAILRYK